MAYEVAGVMFLALLAAGILMGAGYVLGIVKNKGKDKDEY